MALVFVEIIHKLHAKLPLRQIFAMIFVSRFRWLFNWQVNIGYHFAFSYSTACMCEFNNPSMRLRYHIAKFNNDKKFTNTYCN